jgi:hypothetical protein
MNGLIEGLAIFALAVGGVVLILIWHNSRVQSIRDSFVRTCTRPEPHVCKVNGPCNGWPK